MADHARSKGVQIPCKVDASASDSVIEIKGMGRRSVQE